MCVACAPYVMCMCECYVCRYEWNVWYKCTHVMLRMYDMYVRYVRMLCYARTLRV